MKRKRIFFICSMFFTIFFISHTANSETKTYVYFDSGYYNSTGTPDTNGDCYASISKTFYGGNEGTITNYLTNSGLDIGLKLTLYELGSISGTASAYEDFTLTGPIGQSSVGALMNLKLSGSMLMAKPPSYSSYSGLESWTDLSIWVEGVSPDQTYSGYSGDYHMQYDRTSSSLPYTWGHYGSNLAPTNLIEYTFGPEFHYSPVGDPLIGKEADFTNVSIQAKFDDLPLNVPLEFNIKFYSSVAGYAAGSNFLNTLTFDPNNPIILGTFDDQGNFTPFDESTASRYSLTSTSGALAGAFEPDWNGNGNGNTVPEPATMLLLGLGLASLAGVRKNLEK